VTEAEVDFSAPVADGLEEGFDDAWEVLGVMQATGARPDELDGAGAHDGADRGANVERRARQVDDREEVVGVLDHRSEAPLALPDTGGDDRQVFRRTYAGLQLFCSEKLPQHRHLAPPSSGRALCR